MTQLAEPSKTTQETTLRPASILRRNRDHAVDLLKGVAILGVVLHHVSNRRFGPEVTEQMAAIVAIFAWSVSAFLFLSGYLTAFSEKQEALPTYIASRARRLLVPYLALGFTYAAVAQVIQSCGLVDAASSRSTTFAAKLLGLLTLSPHYGEQLYFFPLLFLIAISFRGIISVLATPRALAALVLMLLMLIALIGAANREGIPTTGFSVNMFVIGLFHFSLGYLYGRTAHSTYWGAVVGAAGVGIGIAAMFRSPELAALAVPLVLFSLVRRLDEPPRCLRLVSLTGVASATIFAYHTPFVLQTLLVFFIQCHLPATANIVASVSLTIATCLTLHWVLHRFSILRFMRI